MGINQDLAPVADANLSSRDPPTANPDPAANAVSLSRDLTSPRRAPDSSEGFEASNGGRLCLRYAGCAVRLMWSRGAAERAYLADQFPIVRFNSGDSRPTRPCHRPRRSAQRDGDRTVLLVGREQQRHPAPDCKAACCSPSDRSATCWGEEARPRRSRRRCSPRSSHATTEAVGAAVGLAYPGGVDAEGGCATAAEAAWLSRPRPAHNLE